MKTDTELQRDLLDELEWEPGVHPEEIDVAVEDGVVTLSGRVASLAERQVAESAARRITGVREVVNNIEVKPPRRSERSDADIARAVVNALEWDARVPHERIDVTVREGKVTLEGNVDWHYQKLAAEDDVRSLIGVKEVLNLITIRPKAIVENVKTRIEDAFRRTANVEAERIRVEIEDGTVILRGNVHSSVERAEIERAAWSAPGVSRVENYITIQP
ncbi:MAG: BON domain-containing protein [Ardenticatenaceae bacterium]|nr:BON domain-containing protein [Ardenticatenaceae bacterium]HBY95098.1 ornithine aminotransferase [Chloroflexota bacterium]